METPTVAKPGKTKELRVTVPRADHGIVKNKTLNERRASRSKHAKLQQPYLSLTELNAAPNLALVRHYPRQPHDANGEDNFVKPRIQTSARVKGLLRNYPITSAADYSDIEYASDDFNLRPRLDTGGVKTQVVVNRTLALNEYHTGGRKAKRIAWECFATEETDRVDRGREAMIVSGLLTTDLDAEEDGRPNHLPPWRQWSTNKLATTNTLT
ncbi:hypothetical protein HBH98_244170 [Parastagonospora nodorum]|nr:hypothetical protein HBH53_230380 [Parastagonospora nodorum]KAH3956351.1 hypothetical protein HBH51_243720 [Parastagonospora nodorum]KAH4215543.1 hypothetical protein HBI06_247770 [Parastagonospora nodorum]KAH4224211.1 hypothetical protein HBI05_241920 [Parastagonospora nodorum]KAH4334270.1 hypothetical protein HBH98_244170 [Parastagonospora nodorum]